MGAVGPWANLTGSHGVGAVSIFIRRVRLPASRQDRRTFCRRAAGGRVPRSASGQARRGGPLHRAPGGDAAQFHALRRIRDRRALPDVDGSARWWTDRLHPRGETDCDRWRLPAPRPLTRLRLHLGSLARHDVDRRPAMTIVPATPRMDADVLVIGSGAGGATTAAVL